MFEARISQGKVLKQIVEALKDLVTDGNFDCSATGLSVQAMDSSHVALIELKLKSEGFEHFRCDRSLSLGLNLTNLSKILKCADNDDLITLSAKDDSDVIELRFEDSAADRISEFEMKLMDIDGEHLSIPDTEYASTIEMPASEFQRIVRDLSILGDSCTIGCTKDDVTFSSTGDLGSGKIVRKPKQSTDKSETDVSINVDDPVELTFALRYLNFFTKASPLSDKVKLEMSEGVPLLVTYTIGDLGDLKFYLAPKMDEEE